jgi:hydrogenase expression/formation protein HypC
MLRGGGAMCLAIPGKILEIYDEQGLRMGKLDFGGTIRKCCLQYIPEAAVGQYALVHVGFAISTIDAEEAARTYELLAQMGDIMAQFEDADPEASEGQGGPR